MPPCGCKRFGASSCELWRIGTTHNYMFFRNQWVWLCLPESPSKMTLGRPCGLWMFLLIRYVSGSFSALPPCKKAPWLQPQIVSRLFHNIQYSTSMKWYIIWSIWFAIMLCILWEAIHCGAEMSTPLFPNLGVATSCDAPHRQRFCIERTLSSVPLESPNTPLGSTFGTMKDLDLYN